MDSSAERPPAYRRFARPVPAWFRGAGLGIFVHWGAYSVPAWAEPIGELGTVDPAYWFAHNPYAEWYFNTIRIDGSPAQRHHRSVYGDAGYDELLDRWTAEAFDPVELVALFRRAGARYVVPTTKHHDGITLWDAPGTGTRNTVARGPRRDLVAAIADATRSAGLRFGAYYSTGLDWWAAPSAPVVDDAGTFAAVRPVSGRYARYVHDQLVDLVDRFAPDVLWADIEYPDAGKVEGPFGLVDVLDRFYAARPDGVVNDRWGATHWDFRTSEYQHGTAVEGAGMWEHCRGIGLSFGYNRLEDERHYLEAGAAVRELVDVVSRGGNLLLNVGPDASGRLPALQRACLDGMARWMAVGSPAVHDAWPVDPAVGRPSDEPWVRWTRSADRAFVVVDADGATHVGCAPDALVLDAAALVDGTPVRARAEAHGATFDLPARTAPGPAVVAVPLRWPQPTGPGARRTAR